MAFGTFDILHPGHLYLFSEAKKFGDKLVVVVARDTTVLRIKHHAPLHKEEERLRLVQKVPGVDEAVLGDEHDYYKVLEQFTPAIICLGYDQKSMMTEKLQEELLRRGLKTIIMHIGPFQENEYKSSKLREKLH